MSACCRCDAPTPSSNHRYCNDCRGSAAAEKAARAAADPRNQQRATWPDEVMALHARLFALESAQELATPEVQAIVRPKLRRAALLIEQLKARLLAAEGCA